MISAEHQAYIDKIEEPRKSELLQLHSMISEIVPNWEQWIVSNHLAFGKYHYRGASGREGEWFHIGLKALSSDIGVYICALDKEGNYLPERDAAKLGKASIGKSCIRTKSIKNLNLNELKKLMIETKEVVGN